jgi:hypothetical protein
VQINYVLSDARRIATDQRNFNAKDFGLATFDEILAFNGLIVFAWPFVVVVFFFFLDFLQGQGQGGGRAPRASSF